MATVFSLILFLVCPTMESLVPQYQIDALVDIYNSLGGNSWFCQWNIIAIQNGNLTDPCGIITTRNNGSNYEVVNSLNFSNDCCYYGAYPPSMFNLTTLRSLTLEMKGNFNLTLDPLLGRLQDLNVFHMNGFRGKNIPYFSMPQSFCKLQKLTDIGIQYSNMKGTIPACIFANNRNLRTFNIQHIKINGSIPNTIGMTNLSKLIIVWVPLIGSIPLEICNLSTLHALHLDNTNISGTIPSCIGNIHKNIDLFLNHNKIEGTIPNSICNLIFTDNLAFIDMPGLSGTIPDCIFPNLRNTYFGMVGTAIEGTIPDSICKSDINYVLFCDNRLFGTFPLCESAKFNNLVGIEVVNNPQLEGIVSNSFLCAPKLADIKVSHNINMDERNVPDCWTKQTTFGSIILDNNNFIGTFPPLNEFVNIQQLSVADNKLEGSLSEIISLNAIISEEITLSNNRFVDDDISTLLRNWINSSNMFAISLNGNSGIKGTLPSFDEGFVKDTVTLLLHDCDIHGRIPQHLSFWGLRYFTLFNNRLSCEIPQKLISYDAIPANTTLIIPGNLFKSDNQKSFPHWIEHYFISAENMYVTEFTEVESWVLLIISSLCLMICITVKIITFITKKKQSKCIEIQFIQSIELFTAKFNDSRILCVTVFLLILICAKSHTYSTLLPLTPCGLKSQNNKFVSLQTVTKVYP
eukprot:457941_1